MWREGRDAGQADQEVEDNGRIEQQRSGRIKH
jgi:hypothetical protein